MIDYVIFSGFLEILDLRFKGKFVHFSDSFQGIYFSDESAKVSLANKKMLEKYYL